MFQNVLKYHISENMFLVFQNVLKYLISENRFLMFQNVLKYLISENMFLVFQNVLKYLISEKLPRLHAHLLNHKVDISLFTFNWFLTIFVDNVPIQLYLRIWDAFLYEGSKVSVDWPMWP